MKTLAMVVVNLGTMAFGGVSFMWFCQALDKGSYFLAGWFLMAFIIAAIAAGIMGKKFIDDED